MMVPFLGNNLFNVMTCSSHIDLTLPDADTYPVGATIKIGNVVFVRERVLLTDNEGRGVAVNYWTVKPKHGSKSK